VSQRWLQTTIAAAITPHEQVVHVLNWKDKTVLDPDMTTAEVAAFGSVVRDQFQLWLDSTYTGTTKQRNLFTTAQTYTEVRTGYLQQAAPNAKPTWIVPTQVASFNPANSVGLSAPGAMLPYEVALAVTHNTNFRGPRFRGRVYLGPLSSALLASDGMFNASLVNGVASKWGSVFLAGVAGASAKELHIVSKTWGTSAKVTGARVGVVPDSQRRRRRGQIESYAQVWGTPVGAVP
jgi:hypothetical protein